MYLTPPLRSPQQKFADVPVSSVHLIGHSLGAHMSGHTGTYLKKIYGLTLPRITGLDPAEPYFNDTHPVTRLDTTDADFVDIIHTDDSPILGFPLSRFCFSYHLCSRFYYYYC